MASIGETEPVPVQPDKRRIEDFTQEELIKLLQEVIADPYAHLTPEERARQREIDEYNRRVTFWIRPPRG